MAKDCPISGDKLPLVVISHGPGGNSTSSHHLAETLADAGFAAAAINHPGNISSDMSRNGDLSSLTERPEDIKQLVDFMIGESAVSHEIDAKRVGFFGFSRGYTGLILLGAVPDWTLCRAFCERSSLHVRGQIGDQKQSMSSLVREKRGKSRVFIGLL